jgi:hypothetical protein
LGAVEKLSDVLYFDRGSSRFVVVSKLGKAGRLQETVAALVCDHPAVVVRMVLCISICRVCDGYMNGMQVCPQPCLLEVIKKTCFEYIVNFLWLGLCEAFSQILL